MENQNGQRAVVLALGLLFTGSAVQAQFYPSSGGSNLTTVSAGGGGTSWELVGIGLNDANIKRHLHIRNDYQSTYSSESDYEDYTLAIRLDFGILNENPEVPTSYRAWDIVNKFGDYQLYNVKEEEIEFSILHENGYTGIGTDEPQGRLDVHSGATSTDALYVRANAVTGGLGGIIHHQSHQYAWQTLAQNTAYENNSSLRFHFTNRTDPAEKEKENILVLHSLGRVGVNTASPAYELDVCGTIRSEEVIVETGWCDYVFAEDYKLMSLSELETFIQTHHHLPNIPSAGVVEAEGLKVADMVPRMMEKIEEMTLYMIELQKQNDALKTQVENLSAQQTK